MEHFAREPSSPSRCLVLDSSASSEQTQIWPSSPLNIMPCTCMHAHDCCRHVMQACCYSKASSLQCNALQLADECLMHCFSQLHRISLHSASKFAKLDQLVLPSTFSSCKAESLLHVKYPGAYPSLHASHSLLASTCEADSSHVVMQVLSPRPR